MGLQKTLETTTLADKRVADAMHTGVVTCPLTTPLRQVARMMATHRIHCVVVYEADGGLPGTDTLWGVVSDLDLVDAAAAADVDERTAGEAVASPLVMIPPDETLERAAQLMREYGTAHLIVVDPETVQPVGVLSTLDIAALVAGLPLARSDAGPDGGGLAGARAKTHHGFEPATRAGSKLDLPALRGNELPDDCEPQARPLALRAPAPEAIEGAGQLLLAHPWAAIGHYDLCPPARGGDGHVDPGGRRCDLQGVREQVVEHLGDPGRRRPGDDLRLPAGDELDAPFRRQSLPGGDALARRGREVDRFRRRPVAVRPSQGQQAVDEQREALHLGEGAFDLLLTSSGEAAVEVLEAKAESGQRRPELV